MNDWPDSENHMVAVDPADDHTNPEHATESAIALAESLEEESYYRQIKDDDLNAALREIGCVPNIFTRRQAE